MSTTNDPAADQSTDRLKYALEDLYNSTAAEAETLRTSGEAIANRIVEEARLEAGAILARARSEASQRSGLKRRLDSRLPGRPALAQADDDPVVRAARAAAASIEDQALARARRTLSEAKPDRRSESTRRKARRHRVR